MAWLLDETERLEVDACPNRGGLSSRLTVCISAAEVAAAAAAGAAAAAAVPWPSPSPWQRRWHWRCKTGTMAATLMAESAPRKSYSRAVWRSEWRHVPWDAVVDGDAHVD